MPTRRAARSWTGIFKTSAPDVYNLFVWFEDTRSRARHQFLCVRTQPIQRISYRLRQLSTGSAAEGFWKKTNESDHDDGLIQTKNNLNLIHCS